MTPSILVLGIGNILMSDDGVGVEVIKILQKEPDIPQNVLLIDGGTQGLDLMPYFENIDKVILIDAIVSKDKKAGDLVVIEHKDIITTLGQKMSVHEIGIVDLLVSLSLIDKEPKELKLIGLTPQSVEFAYGLSQVVQKNIPTLIEAIKSQIKSWSKEYIC